MQGLGKKAEEKAKVVPAGWGAELIPSGRYEEQDELHLDDMKNRMN